MYSNAEKLTAVLTHWLSPMGDAVVDKMLGDKLAGINAWAKKIFPVSQNYSIANDLGFLLKPSVDMVLAPAIHGLLEHSGVDDAHIPAYAHRLVSSMTDECAEKGNITLFESVVLKGEDFAVLHDLLNKNLPIDGSEMYQVIQ